jgi:hypothetical protein
MQRYIGGPIHQKGWGRLFYLGVLLLYSTSQAQLEAPYTLKVAPVANHLTLWINQDLAAEYRDATKINLQDISSQLKLGNNTLRIRWQGLNRSGDVAIRSKEGEVLFSYPFDETKQPEQGDLRFNVVIEANRTLFASKTPNVAVSIPPEVRLSVKMSGGMLGLSLNNLALGDYAGSSGRFLHSFKPGNNTLKVNWSKDFGSSLPVGSLEILREGKRVLFWNTDAITTLQGSQMLSFKI